MTSLSSFLTSTTPSTLPATSSMQFTGNSTANDDSVERKERGAENCLSGIPMPPTSSTNCSTDEQTSAWEKAQMALKKANVAAAALSSTPLVPTQAPSSDNYCANALQYYPWAGRSSLQPLPYSTQTLPFSAPQNPYSYMMNPYMPQPSRVPQPFGYNASYPNPQQIWMPNHIPGPSNQRFTNVQVRERFRPNNSHQPLRFSIPRPRQLPNAPAFKPNSPASHTKISEIPNIPESVRNYVERAYLAVEAKADRDKLEEYFKQKLNPLLASGAYKTVDWDNEPLPSEVNFELKMGWTPASELKKTVSVNPLKSDNRSKKANKEFDRWNDAHSSSFRDQPKKRLSFNPRVRLASPDDEIIADVQKFEHKETSQKKKKKRKTVLKTRWIADEESDMRREERAKRFARNDDTKREKLGKIRDRLEWCIDVQGDGTTSDVVVGTSNEVEKSYFRLTSAPDASTVRPMRFLEKALRLVQMNYATNRNYVYANDQLKSIRQDLMIQCIRSQFTVNVYETNARIAIEQGDREEFNQCQNQLKLLYKELQRSPNKYEFTSYRLLYYISVASTIDQNTLLSELDEKARDSPCIIFALKVREAWALTNYVKLFKLYDEAPRMASYVMDLFLERERKAALTSCLKAFRPNITLSALGLKIGLEEDKLCEWLAALGINTEDGKIDCRVYSSKVIS